MIYFSCLVSVRLILADRTALPSLVLSPRIYGSKIEFVQSHVHDVLPTLSRDI